MAGFPSRAFAGLFLMLTTALQAEMPTVSVRSGKLDINPVAGIYTLPAAPAGATFQVGQPPAANNPNAKRIRWKLEGRDAKWQEESSEMNFVVRFYDRNGNQISQHIFPCSGISSGWKRTPDESMFTHRRESVTAPALADNVRILISSAGPPSAVGILVVDDIVVSEISPQGTAGRRLLELLPSSISSDAPNGWARAGSHPDLAKVIRLTKEGLSEEVLTIVDHDPIAHAEWQIIAPAAPKVRPEERILVEWNEMFSIGNANLFSANYPDLETGRYRFIANELDVYGNPTSTETSLAIEVPIPYWKTPWFLIVMAALVASLTALMVRSAVRLKMRRQLETLQRERVVEQERLRIARDIHDDLGARLTHISLVSGMAEGSAETDRERSKFAEISGMARELVHAMYETVWSVNPQNDHLESLISFLCQSTENLCKPADIRCRIQAAPILEDRDVRSEIRHNAILAVKEVVHNAIKHSRASVIELRVSYAAPTLHITVADDGGGFDVAEATAGNGLKNVRRRMESIGGEVSFQSTAAGGTQVQFFIPIP